MIASQNTFLIKVRQHESTVTCKMQPHKVKSSRKQIECSHINQIAANAEKEKQRRIHN